MFHSAASCDTLQREHEPTSDPSAPRFVRGDRVESTVTGWGDSVPIGSTGTVVNADPTGAKVFFDHDPIGDGSGTSVMLNHELTPIGCTSNEQAHLRETRGAAELVAYALHGHPNQA
jgi:hypothetical protein